MSGYDPCMVNRSYPAVLDGDRVRWIDAAPEQSGPMNVAVTVLGSAAIDPAVVRDPGRAMADVLGALAASGAFADAVDPVEWQRDLRQDRILAGRSPGETPDAP